MTVSDIVFPIAPTAVTELSVEPESSTELKVSWELPENPNGPLSGYVVYYREQAGTQPPLPVITSSYSQSTVDYPEVDDTEPSGCVTHALVSLLPDNYCD